MPNRLYFSIGLFYSHGSFIKWWWWWWWWSHSKVFWNTMLTKVDNVLKLRLLEETNQKTYLNNWGQVASVAGSLNMIRGNHSVLSPSARLWSFRFRSLSCLLLFVRSSRSGPVAVQMLVLLMNRLNNKQTCLGFFWLLPPDFSFLLLQLFHSTFN